MAAVAVDASWEVHGCVRGFAQRVTTFHHFHLQSLTPKFSFETAAIIPMATQPVIDVGNDGKSAPKGATKLAGTPMRVGGRQAVEFQVVREGQYTPYVMCSG